MKHRHILLAAMMSASLPAMAEAPDDAAPRIVHRTTEVIVPGGTPAHAFVFASAGDGAQVMGESMSVMSDGKVVKGAPYTAEVVSEKVQNLADGNQIVNKSTSMSYRDSAGRTRHDIVDSKGEVRMATIRDGDKGNYILHPHNKTALKLGDMRAPVARAAREAARARVEQLRKEGKLPAAGESKEREAIIVKRVERAHGDVHRQVQESVRIRMKALEGMQGRPFGPALAGAFNDARWAAQATTRDLGTRNIEGVKAEGKMRSYDIPAGAIGNRHPITVTQETWYSPELQVTVYSKHTDPRTGERIFRLSNLKRVEPAASLFAIPADYTVRNRLAPRAGPDKK